MLPLPTIGAPRVRVEDDNVQVYIAAAMLGPPGGGKDGEWMSPLNLESSPVDLAERALVDKGGKSVVLSGILEPGGPRRSKASPGSGRSNSRTAGA